MSSGSGSEMILDLMYKLYIFTFLSISFSILSLI